MCLSPFPRLLTPSRLFPLGGLNIQGEDDSYDFGTGAGFYVDATKEPWSRGYKMYSYITSELPQTVFDTFKQVDGSRVSIFGHSMGGHGALTLVRPSATNQPPGISLPFQKEEGRANGQQRHGRRCCAWQG